ncbi:MAG: hypothetical protein F9K32_04565 [Desulfobulbaceae bacterium]|nr:MAG: hypothetical protein F9K32_04565 [Desulfobulbaceae bacterium]
MNRVLVGLEPKLRIFGTSCPWCNQQKGYLHHPGCPLESCPDCGGRLISCGCMVLEEVDRLHLILELAETLTPVEVECMMSQRPRSFEKSYTDLGLGMLIINVTEDLDTVPLPARGI